MFKIKVLFDARMLHYSGIGRYTRNLVLALLRHDKSMEVTLAGNIREIDEFRFQESDVSQRLNGIEFDAPVYSITEALAFPFWKELARRFDIVHFPHYNVPMFLPPNSVVTIHDVIQFTNLKHEYSRLKLLAAKTTLLRALKAKAILTVSELTKTHLVDKFGASEERIKALYPLLSQGYKIKSNDAVKQVTERLELGDHYILFVGSTKRHKNADLLFEAFSIVMQKYPSLNLVVVGKSFDRQTITSQFGIEGALEHNVILLPELPDDVLSLVYAGAAALVMPSLEEGYGYPPIEALSCGTPVVVSDIPIFRETLGDRAIFFNPQSVRGLVNSILQAVNGVRPVGASHEELVSASIKAADFLTRVYASVITGPK